jgi:hypothetical protein
MFYWLLGSYPLASPDAYPHSGNAGASMPDNDPIATHVDGYWNSNQ